MFPFFLVPLLWPAQQFDMSISAEYCISDWGNYGLINRTTHSLGKYRKGHSNSGPQYLLFSFIEINILPGHLAFKSKDHCFHPSWYLDEDCWVSSSQWVYVGRIHSSFSEHPLRHTRGHFLPFVFPLFLLVGSGRAAGAILACGLSHIEVHQDPADSGRALTSVLTA